MRVKFEQSAGLDAFIKDLKVGTAYLQKDRPGEVFIKTGTQCEVKCSAAILGTASIALNPKDRNVDPETISVCLKDGKAIVWYYGAKATIVDAIILVKEVDASSVSQAVASYCKECRTTMACGDCHLGLVEGGGKNA